jgi:sugar/nucleoside kinase (ribokinase family)
VRFLAVGDIFVDVIASGVAHDARVRLAPGGSAVNAALSAVRSGAEAGILGRVGDDPPGRMAQVELAAEGVVTQLSADPDRPTGTFLVVDGEIRVDRGANAGFLPEHLPPELEADATLVSGHLPTPTVAASLERSSARWNALAAARLTRLPDGGNAVFVNGAEAHALTGAQPAEAARLLGNRYRLVCVTLEADGVIGLLDGTLESARAEIRSTLDDVTGAGDAFAAAVLVALSADAPFRDALASGCRAGALASFGERRRT